MVGVELELGLRVDPLVNELWLGMCVGVYILHGF